jgi:group II intron reverse transcriptase/maturase
MVKCHKGLARIEKIRELNETRTNWVNKDLYKLLLDKDLLIAAYESIKSKQGNMTRGLTGTTLDGYSLEVVEATISELRDESFNFSPARRVMIPKSNGKSRPLGISPPTEKVVQKAMEIILSAIYEPTFSEHSHGFRPSKGCHTALKVIKDNWTGTVWFIEGDIQNYFDDINHQKLVKILRKRISDERFLNLIWKSLRAGVMVTHSESKDAKPQRLNRKKGLSFRSTSQGTPQGSIISPILANIFLHEFDQKVDEWAEEFKQGDTAKPPKAKEYTKAVDRSNRLRKKLEGKVKMINGETRESVIAELKNLSKSMRDMKSTSDGWVRIKYVRYADDWIIGINGDKKVATTIRAKAAEWLSDTLYLSLSPEKTHITHAVKSEANFLGTRICASKGFLKRRSANGRSTVAKTGVGAIHLKAPMKEIMSRLAEKGFCRKGYWFPTAKRDWLVYDEWEIVERYNAVLRGVLNYYSFAYNRSKLQRVHYTLKFSLAHTLANRRRTSISKVLSKGKNCPTAFKNTRTGRVPVKFETPSFKTNTKDFRTGAKLESVVNTYFNKRSRSKLGSHCAICLETEGVVMHHLRHIRKVGVRVKGFDRVMSALNRKQLPVCQGCHHLIHTGKYDGLSLSGLADQKLAAA